MLWDPVWLNTPSKITRIPCDRIRLMIISTHLKTVIQV